MVNFKKLDFLRFLTINSVTTGARELNGTSQKSLATHNSKRKMREIFRSRENNVYICVLGSPNNI